MQSPLKAQNFPKTNPKRGRNLWNNRHPRKNSYHTLSEKIQTPTIGKLPTPKDEQPPSKDKQPPSKDLQPPSKDEQTTLKYEQPSQKDPNSLANQRQTAPQNKSQSKGLSRTHALAPATTERVPSATSEKVPSSSTPVNSLCTTLTSLVNSVIKTSAILFHQQHLWQLRHLR